MTTKLIRKYLENYSCSQIHWLEESLLQELNSTYEYILVIPIHDEEVDCIQRLLPSNISDILIIIVVNCAEDSDEISKQKNYNFLKHHGVKESPITVVPYNPITTLLMVDCCRDNRQLPPKKGVGLARKIGADIALWLIQQGYIKFPWIYCTDGDVTLPENYFNPEGLTADVAVGIYPFYHHPPHRNILLYEISLRYYVTQLVNAGSPYGFHTIGSLLVINNKNYAAVRGFPPREAAEDFYMLNKLAKTGKVLPLKSPQILLSSRLSHRVPFGTGAAMQRLVHSPEFLFYHPHIFKDLKLWLETIENLWSQYRLQVSEINLSQWWQQQQLPTHILNTLLKLGLEKTLSQAYRQCKDYPHFKFFLETWFDAFRTLKFIHDLRENYFPSIPLKQVIELSPHLTWKDFSEEDIVHLQGINQQLIAQEM